MNGIEMMEKYGGSFVRALANAWCRADAVNKKRLEDNFPYFKEYEEEAKRYKE